ncbi:MAG TPA: hypothetical protein VFQ61_24610 [Polyangiaceae bacterium]|nr:hypothetical protein [Polyangiaceae bacterium]
MRLSRTRRLRHDICALGCAGALAWTGTARAYRPFTGTDAAIASPGEVEIEFGPAALIRQGQDWRLSAPAVVLNYGVSSQLEAILEGRHDVRLGKRSEEPRSQLEDSAVSLKMMLRNGSLQDGTGLSIAIEAGALLPSPDRKLGTHVASIVSMRWPEFTIHVNVANDVLLAPRQYEAMLDVIAEGSERVRVRPVTEILVSREFGNGKFSRALTGSLLIGLIARYDDSLSIDCALRGGRAPERFEEELRAGLTWSFEVTR